MLSLLGGGRSAVHGAPPGRPRRGAALGAAGQGRSPRLPSRSLRSASSSPDSAEKPSAAEGARARTRGAWSPRARIATSTGASHSGRSSSVRWNGHRRRQLPRPLAAGAHDFRGGSQRPLARARDRGGARAGRTARARCHGRRRRGLGGAPLRSPREPALAAGWAAALLAWALHASIDWDWQLPAVCAAGDRACRRARRRERGQRRVASGLRAAQFGRVRVARAPAAYRGDEPEQQPPSVAVLRLAAKHALGSRDRLVTLTAGRADVRALKVRRRVGVEQLRPPEVVVGACEVLSRGRCDTAPPPGAGCAPSRPATRAPRRRRPLRGPASCRACPGHEPGSLRVRIRADVDLGGNAIRALVERHHRGVAHGRRRGPAHRRRGPESVRRRVLDVLDRLHQRSPGRPVDRPRPGWRSPRRCTFVAGRGWRDRSR